MILPKEKSIYENLNTSFTNFEELLADLKTNHFTGFMRIVYWDYEGILFFDSGSIINALEETEGNRKIEQEAINNLLTKVKEKNGTISVYSLSSDLVTMLAGTVKSEIVYKDLSSDFTNLKKLLEKLNDAQHTGYIEILTGDGKHIATIFIQAGEPIESVLSTENEVIVTAGIQTQLFEHIQSEGAIFNVYKAGIGTHNGSLATGADILPLLDFWGQVIAIIERKLTPDTFNQVFKETLIAKANNYPFLDPFAEEFDYANGKISFEGNIAENFSAGLGEVIREMLLKLNDPDINSELEMLKNSQGELLEKYSLNNIFM